MLFCVWGARFPPLSGALFFACVLAACSTPQTRALVAESPASLPLQSELFSTPFFAQSSYHCGPAALAGALGAAGIQTTADTLASQVYLPERKGSLQIEMLAAARRNGAVAVVLEPQLSSALDTVAQGHPVIVLQNLALPWFPRWHYAVLIGYELDSRSVILRSGTIQRLVIPMTTFERTWARSGHWAMAAVLPGEIPAGAMERGYVDAAIAYEKLAAPADSVKAYEAGTQRWPGNGLAWMGLGNSAFRQTDWLRAEQAFRQAAVLASDRAPALNNLALALSEQGRAEEAILAAEEAVAAGGQFEATARATLSELLNAPESTTNREAGK